MSDLDDRFTAACALRDAGDLAGAKEAFHAIIADGAHAPAEVQPEVAHLVAHAHIQLGNFLDEDTGSFAAGEAHFRAATELLPDNELASIALFHALFGQRRRDEAFAEAIRVLSLRTEPSPLYAELLDDLFDQLRDGDSLAIVARARVLLVRA